MVDEVFQADPDENGCQHPLLDLLAELDGRDSVARSTNFPSMSHPFDLIFPFLQRRFLFLELSPPSSNFAYRLGIFRSLESGCGRRATALGLRPAANGEQRAQAAAGFPYQRTVSTFFFQFLYMHSIYCWRYLLTEMVAQHCKSLLFFASLMVGMVARAIVSELPEDIHSLQLEYFISLKFCLFLV